MESDGAPPAETRDAVIILAAQKVEHCEIAPYDSIATWARMVGRDDLKRSG
jgi:ferritin-like metal-binding protein YciE